MQADTAITRHAPTAPTTPPILVVDAMHRGDHTTISAALKAAKPGTRILVRPGRYTEGLMIDKPVEIIGDGEPGEVTVAAKGADVVLFKTTMGRIANLALRQLGEGEFGVDIAQGQLLLEDCDITSDGLSCVAIHGDADPRLRRNCIHDGKQFGVVVYENGQGSLEDNNITANQWGALFVADGGRPVLRGNQLSRNGAFGITITTGGGGTFERNDLRQNQLGPWNIDKEVKTRIKSTGNIEA